MRNGENEKFKEETIFLFLANSVQQIGWSPRNGTS
jgi:hypothetical protein